MAVKYTGASTYTAVNLTLYTYSKLKKYKFLTYYISFKFSSI